jgi:glycosyltransferase involved in cell wall biosynthesis
MPSPFRAAIPAVPNGTPRPYWSVMIPTYNNGDFLRETLLSVLKQDAGHGEMQIEVVDDHSSSGDPAAIVAEIGAGRVGYFRQERNVGHIANFATCLTRSTGKVVHLLHGDDAVRPNFYAALKRGLDAVPDAGAAFCRSVFSDGEGHQLSTMDTEQAEAGLLVNAASVLGSEQRIMTPSIVVRRDVYEALGGFDARLKCAEDWEMWVRIASRYPVWYEPQPLALYRMHANSNTGRHVRSAEDMSFTRKAIDMFASYLPSEIRSSVVRRAKRLYARSSIEMAGRLKADGDLGGMGAQLREAARFDFSPRTLVAAARVLVGAQRR